jgi:hypothetical protein
MKCILTSDIKVENNKRMKCILTSDIKVENIHKYNYCPPHEKGISSLPGSCRLVLFFIRDILHTGASEQKRKKQVRCIKFTFRFIDEVFTLNSCKFDDLVDRIYLNEFEIKDSTDTYRSDSHLDLHPEIESQVRLKTNLYDKRVISMIHC